MFCPPLVTKLGDEKTAGNCHNTRLQYLIRLCNVCKHSFQTALLPHATSLHPKCPSMPQVEAKKEQASSANSYFILQCLPLYDSQKRERETTVIIVAVGIYIFQTSFIVFYDGGKHEGRVQWAMTNRSS